MVGDIFAGRFSYKAAGEERRMVIMVILSLVPLVAFFFIKDILASFSEDGDIIVEGVSFIFTGSMLFLADKCVKGRKTAGDMRPAEALCVGFFQGFAVLPGVSRSGSTISAGLLCGFSREHAVTFSFIMGIPAMIGAGIFEVRDAVQAGLSIEAAPIIVGIAASAIVGFFAIKLINWLVKTNRFGAFAYYTLALGALVLAAGIVEMFAGRSITELAAGLF
jgi:undecaprenyl-diphosphatase